MSTVVEALYALMHSARGDRGWGVAAGRGADVESTAWVLVLAALDPAAQSMRAAAIDSLHAMQDTSGLWTVSAAETVSSWPTFPALVALQIAATGTPPQRDAADRIARGVRAILEQHSATPSRWQRLVARVRDRGENRARAVELDPALDGFGWSLGTFAWVEPTALALIALQLAHSASPREDARERAAMCTRLLLDRQAPDGGWNYGNKRVLDVDLPGYPDTTAWALLALRASTSAGSGVPPAVVASAKRAVIALDGTLRAEVSPLALALKLLATRAWRREIPRSLAQSAADRTALETMLEPALVAQQEGYPLLETRTVALSLLALGEQDLIDAVHRAGVSER